MKLVVLISCMHQQDTSIIEKSNVQTDVVVINQCNKDSIERFTFINKYGNKCKACFVNTKERGLSRSRNMAIRYADGDICLICDDDEWLEDDYEKTILQAHEENPSVGVIAFSLIRKDITKKYPIKPGFISFRRIFSVNSIQLSFKLDDILCRKIVFDEKMGSGTGNGGGEENKFLMDCRRKRVKLYYIPKIIATVNPNISGSKWFQGFTKKYFSDVAWASRRIFNPVISLAYIGYVCFSKHHLYKNDLAFYEVLYSMMKGWMEKR